MMRFLQAVDEAILAYVAAFCEWAWDWLSISRKQWAHGFNLLWLLFGLLTIDSRIWFGWATLDLFFAFCWAIVIHLDFPVSMFLRIFSLEAFLAALGIDVVLPATQQRFLNTCVLLAGLCVTYFSHPQQPPKGPRGGKRKEGLE